MSGRNVNPKVTYVDYIYILIHFLLLVIFYILFELPMPDKKNLQSGFCLFFTYSKMQLLTGIIDNFLAWETWYIIQLFQIVFHTKELKLLLKSLIIFSWRNCDHRIISQMFFRSSQHPVTLLKKRLWHKCFPVNFEKFLRTTVLQNTSGRLLLVL